jgi:putative transposase
VNKKRVYRLASTAWQAVRRVATGRCAAGDRAGAAVRCVSVSSGRRFRALTVVDTAAWRPASSCGSISGERVGRFLDELATTHGLPTTITVDNGPEFISNALDQWAYARGVTLHFIQPASRRRTRSSRASMAASATSA